MATKRKERPSIRYGWPNSSVHPDPVLRRILTVFFAIPLIIHHTSPRLRLAGQTSLVSSISLADRRRTGRLLFPPRHMLAKLPRNMKYCLPGQTSHGDPARQPAMVAGTGCMKLKGNWTVGGAKSPHEFLPFSAYILRRMADQTKETPHAAVARRTTPKAVSTARASTPYRCLDVPPANVFKRLSTG